MSVFLNYANTLGNLQEKKQRYYLLKPWNGLTIIRRFIVVGVNNSYKMLFVYY